MVLLVEPDNMPRPLINGAQWQGLVVLLLLLGQLNNA
jgi:hypothetical protein